MDKKRRRWKKNIRRNARAIARKIPFAFENGRDRRAFINDIVKNHPALIIVKIHPALTNDKIGDDCCHG